MRHQPCGIVLLLPAEPHRPFRLRADWLDRVDPHGGTVRITAV
ncbi:hypothetical protein [Streptomyces sp. NPDC048496]